MWFDLNVTRHKFFVGWDWVALGDFRAIVH